jgi:hypothetical protein
MERVRVQGIREMRGIAETKGGEITGGWRRERT